MADRRGEKTGWILGWLGGFLWLLILAVVFAVQGRTSRALPGFILFGVAAACILFFRPWRHPATPYWKLMIAPYALIFLSAAWAIRSFGGMKASGLSRWSLMCFLPLLIPFLTSGKKTWKDSETLPQGDRDDHGG